MCPFRQLACPGARRHTRRGERRHGRNATYAESGELGNGRAVVDREHVDGRVDRDDQRATLPDP